MKQSLNFYKILPLFLPGVFLNSCSDQIVTEADVKPIPVAKNIRLSKFSELQKNIFTPSCALPGCHTGPNPQHGLDLTSGKAYTNLINIQSVHFPTLKRVLPGNKEQSVLYRGISFTIPELQMPPTGKISQYLIDSLGVWIDKGAPND